MRRRIDYEDLTVQIRAVGDHFEARLRAAPVGVGGDRQRLRLPWEPRALEALLHHIGTQVRASGEVGEREDREERDLVARGAERPGALTPQQLGGQLFEALFTGPLGRRLDMSLGWLDGDRGNGLRLRLVFNLEEEGILPVAALPWELLYRPETRDFFGRMLHTSVVRVLEVPRGGLPPPVGPPLRVLVIPAAHRRGWGLDLEGEGRHIEAAWAPLPGVCTEVTPAADTAELRRRLRDFEPHIVHFMGHGSFNGASEEGQIFLTGAEGVPRPVAGQVLAETFKGLASLRLVVLNACDTARFARRRGVDPYTGVATALVMAGLPAVVAMQFPLSDGAAIAFSRAFYTALAAGDPVDAAVAEGRLAIYQLNRRSLQWATPALFLRVGEIALVEAGVTGEGSEKAGAGAPQDGEAAGPPVGQVAESDSPVGQPSPVAPQGGDGEGGGAAQGGAGGGGRGWWWGRLSLWLAACAAAVTAVVGLWPSPADPPGCPSIRELGIEFVRIEPGWFHMGSEVGNEDEQPVHRVTLTRPYCLAETEVTVGQWRAVMGEDAGRAGEGKEYRAAASMTWLETQEFLRRFEARYGVSGLRLPTEAEWEYAARAGTRTAFSFGDDLEEVEPYANCLSGQDDDGFDAPAPVGSFPPNPWGLYDMHGNVWEWVADWYAPSYPPGPATDPRGPEEGSEKVRRGGAYDASPENCRSASRKSSEPDSRRKTWGFRLARDVEPGPDAP